MQCIGHSGCKAFDLLRLCRGNPLKSLFIDSDYISFTVQDLDRRSRKFFLSRDVRLADPDLGLRVSHQHYAILIHCS